MKIFKVNSFSFDSETNIIHNGDRTFHFKYYDNITQYFTFQCENSTSRDYVIPLCAFISSKEEQKKFLDWFEKYYPHCFI